MEKVLHPTCLTHTITPETSSVSSEGAPLLPLRPTLALMLALRRHITPALSISEASSEHSRLELELFCFYHNENCRWWKRQRDDCSLQGLESLSCSETPFTHYSPSHHLTPSSFHSLIFSPPLYFPSVNPSPSHPFHRLIISPLHLTLSSYLLTASSSHPLTPSSHPLIFFSSHPLIFLPSHPLNVLPSGHCMLSSSHFTLSSPYPVMISSMPTVEMGEDFFIMNNWAVICQNVSWFNLFIYKRQLTRLLWSLLLR